MQDGKIQKLEKLVLFFATKLPENIQSDQLRFSNSQPENLTSRTAKLEKLVFIIEHSMNLTSSKEPRFGVAMSRLPALGLSVLTFTQLMKSHLWKINLLQDGRTTSLKVHLTKIASLSAVLKAAPENDFPTTLCEVLELNCASQQSLR
jgi:hypothetical protein